MKYLVVGDVHNRLEKFRHLLIKSGAIESDGKTKNEDIFVIQLGDLFSLGYDEKEIQLARFAEKYVDEFLIGNHELPAIYWDPEKVWFNGWEERDERVANLVKKRYDEGGYKAASCVGDWLITHAGLQAPFQDDFVRNGDDAFQVAYNLNGAFFEAQRSELSLEVFENVDTWRAGPYGASHGGIFWGDWRSFTNNRGSYPQIVGHTGAFGPRFYPTKSNQQPPAWNVDSRDGDVCGVFTQNEGMTWELVIGDGRDNSTGERQSLAEA